MNRIYLAAWAAPLIFAFNVQATVFSSIVNFGDSLSDVGNVYSATGGLIPGSPGYYNGRFSNGPIWIDNLSSILGLGTVSNSSSGGNDYAYGDATSGGGTTLGIIHNIGMQITDFTSARTATPSQLFTMLGGANDLINQIDGSGAITASQAADNIATGIQALYNDGARNVLVANLPDLGLTPRYHGTSDQSQASSLTNQFNTELSSDLDGLVSSNSGLTLFRLDLYGLFNDVVADPGAYGLTDVTDAAYSGDSSYLGNGTAVSDPSGYLFWDQQHPTSQGSTIIAGAASAAIPEPASLMAAGFVLVAMLDRRRVNRNRA